MVRQERIIQCQIYMYTLFADSIEDAKRQIEEMLIDHWNEEIDYLENRIKSFQDEE